MRREIDLRTDVMFSTLATLLDGLCMIQTNREHHYGVAKYDEDYQPPQLQSVFGHERRMLESIMHEMEVLIPSVKQRILYLNAVQKFRRVETETETGAAADA